MWRIAIQLGLVLILPACDLNMTTTHPHLEEKTTPDIAGIWMVSSVADPSRCVIEPFSFRLTKEHTGVGAKVRKWEGESTAAEIHCPQSALREIPAGHILVDVHPDRYGDIVAFFHETGLQLYGVLTTSCVGAGRSVDCKLRIQGLDHIPYRPGDVIGGWVAEKTTK